MNTRTPRGLTAVSSALILCAASLCSGAGVALPLPQPATAADSGGSAGQAKAPNLVWPRTFEKAGTTVVMYQPQVDSWKDHAKIRFRAAVAVTLAGSGQTHYGVAAVEADTLVDDEARTVLMTNLDVVSRFPGLPDATVAPLKAAVGECLPNLNFLDVSLDQVLAHMQTATKVPTVSVNLQPPPIYYSDVPAILVVYLGQPQLKPVPGTKLMFAVNTNWVVLMDMNSSQYFLLDGDSWLTAPDPVRGPWSPAGALPSDFSRLPDGANWDSVKQNIPGQPLKTVPRVISSVEPAELIVTDGPPEYTPVEGTRLMYISDPAMPLFLDLADGNYYYLVAGRWFSAPQVTGPWAAASASLPAEFAKIPPDSPLGFVLASVPGTQEARDAVLLATVPHKTTVKLSEAKVAVTYDGAPQFIPVDGTSMTYAVNTPYQVVFAAGQYYCCYQGVWFTAYDAAGPWSVCTSVPPVIYTIPPSCPLYNCTYVQVYGSTPSTVVVGYTGGYSGEYVAATGALMFGAGMVTGALLASHSDCWYGCSPCYYSYGCAAHYNYAYGGYYRSGGAYYGPHGGAGWGSSYNPSTGTWARGGYAYGPAGAHWGAQAYNPFTNTYGAHAGGTHGYQSWGASTVSRGDQWASAQHQSGVRGSAGWAENSSGQWAEGAHSNATNSSVARTSSGDVYAGHDGNVYKNSGGQWQKYSGNGNWQDTAWDKPAPSSYRQPTSSAATESNWQSGAQNRASSNSFQSWQSGGDASQFKSDWQSGSGFGGGQSGQGGWGQHDTQTGLNQDSWARNSGTNNAFSSWSSGLSGGGGGGWGGGGGGGAGRWGGGGFGGGGFGGGGFGGFGGGGRFRR